MKRVCRANSVMLILCLAVRMLQGVSCYRCDTEVRSALFGVVLCRYLGSIMTPVASFSETELDNLMAQALQVKIVWHVNR